jgi:microcystin-dependent protein
VSDPFTGEIRMFGFNFAPRGWATCDGQLLSISQNTALFSILGTFYGGNGSTTFALPNLADRMPMGAGQGNGLSFRPIGQSGGTPTVSLLRNEMPQHNHGWKPSTEPANLKQPNPTRSFAAASANAYAPGNPTSKLAAQTIGETGQSQPHSNIQPSLGVLFCVALQGDYPKRG